MHLWEAKHPYYCSEHNYFRGQDCTQAFASWSDFVAEEGDADMDYNLVFRWDWSIGSDADEDGSGFIYDGVQFGKRGQHHLQICWMTQRKGYYRTTFVKVTPDDEPSVRAWLQQRLNHLLCLWAPLVQPPPEEPEAPSDVAS